MTARQARMTWALVAVLAGVYVAGEVLLAASGSRDESSLVTVAFTAMALTYLAVGGLVATRLPTNPIGWLFGVAGLFMGLTSISYGYAALVVDPTTHSQPGAGVTAAWISSVSWIPPLLCVPALVFLLFPDGRPIGPRWRGVVVMIGAGLGLVLAGIGLREGGLVDSPRPALANPVGLLPLSVAEATATAGFVLSLVSVVLAAWSLIIRFRRSRSVERLQLKWLMWSAGFLPLYLAVGLVTWVLDRRGGDLPGELVLALCLTVVPLAVGAAILRYRLYDIDLVINRTLVYATLTATLAAAYLTSVLLLRVALDPLTSGSDLAVAGSTLAVAALFRPLRTRIQATVDRRFYRARYDAALTLDSFATHLRDELDLATLQHDLRRVVLDTVHPTDVSVWLKGASR